MFGKCVVCFIVSIFSLGISLFFGFLEKGIYSFSVSPGFSGNPCREIQDLSEGWDILDSQRVPKEKTNLPKNLFPISPGFVYLSRNVVYSSPSEECSLAFYLGKVSENLRIFWNGQSIYNQEEYEDRYDRTRILYGIPISSENRIDLYIWGYFPKEIGVLSGTSKIGPADKIRKEYYVFQISLLILISLFFLIGFYFLLLGLKETSLSSNLFFGTFLVLFSVYEFLGSEWKYELGLSFSDCKKLEYCILPFLFPSFFAFLSGFFGVRMGKVSFLLFLWSVLCASIFYFSESILNMDHWNRTLLQPSWIPYCTLILLRMIDRIRSGEKDAFGFLGAILVLFVSIGLDIAIARGIADLPRTSGFSVLGLIVFSGFRLSQRFIEMKLELEVWNGKLQEEVKSRTEELRESLQEARAMKEKQDGDYFLMGILQKSFESKLDSYAMFRLETLSSQFKKFEFKGKTWELGGDAIWMEEVKLGEKTYLALMNSDAMGKSLQGAAGSLLISALFRAKILSFDSSPQPPENWLVGVYQEFHRVFQTFDGNLFVTGVFCLLDPETSSLFLLNSDHPRSVLVRRGIAGFLEEDSNPKMGFPFDSTQVRVIGLSLEEGDRILIGSDGREDLRLREESSEIRSFSEEFLNIASESPSDLESIRNRIRMLGDFTDDLSLVQMVRESYEETSRASGKRSEISKRKTLQTAVSFWKSGRRKEALLRFESLALTHPMDLELSYLTAWALYKSGNFDRARIYSEKILYRESKKEENILLLAKIYFKLGYSKDRIVKFLAENGLDGESFFRTTNILKKAS